MKPQSPEAAAAQLAAMTGQQPPQGAQPPQPPQPQQAAPAPPPPAPEKPTLDSKAEGESGEGPVSFMFKVGDDEISMTPEQASGMYSRYNQLLEQTADARPFMEFGKQLMSRLPPGTDPAQAVRSLVTALTKNPQMGQQAQQQSPQGAPPQQTSNEDISERLKKWETENATQLPPGYTDMLGTMQGFQNQFQTMQGMMQQLLAATAGQTDATRAGAVQNVQDATRNQKDRIMNNMGKVQQAMKLSDEDFQPFLQFATQRGYSLPEFIDIQLLAQVAGDYKRAKDEPRMKLLEEVSNRRKAYTEEPSGTPGGASPSGQQGPDLLANMLKSKGL